jgi:molybdate transport system permease protein
MNLLDRILILPLLFFSLIVGGVLAALIGQISPEELARSLVHPETLFALRFSLATSCAAMFIALSIGIGAAYFLSRHTFPGKAFLETLLDIPLAMPPLVAGVGLLFLLGKDFLGGSLARWGIHFVLAPWGAVVAQSFVATPIVLRSAQAAFASVPKGYEEAALMLGLSPLQIFFRINIPLAGKSLLAGTMLAWARTLGEFGATLMVAGATRFRTETLPIAVYLNISSGELGIAMSCSLVLLGTAFALLLCARMLHRTSSSDILPEKSFRWPG